MNRRDWMAEAEASAAREWGAKHKDMFALKHHSGGIGIVAGLIGLGLGARWLWVHVHLSNPFRPVAEHSDGMPWLLVVAYLVTMAGTVFVFRPKASVTRFGVRIAQLAVALIIWIFLIVFTIGYLT
jgi:hypothetical protein